MTNFNSGTPGFYRTFRRSWTTFRFTFRLHMHFDDWGTKIKDIISKPPLSPRRNGKIETLLYFLITGIPSFLGNIFPFPVYINMINHVGISLLLVVMGKNIHSYPIFEPSTSFFSTYPIRTMLSSKNKHKKYKQLV